MKKIIINILMISLILFFAACSNGESSGESNDKPTALDKFLTIGSGPMGSGWYPITTALTELYSKEFHDLNATHIEGASTSNLKALEVGDVQMAINYTNDFISALEGGTGFEEPLETIAAFGSLYPVYQTIATTAGNEEINSIEDIVDKHIFLGPQGGGGPLAFWLMMEEYGIDEQTITDSGGQVSYGNYNDGASMLKDNNVDIFLGGGAPYVPALQEMEITQPIKVLPLDQDKLESLEARGLGITAGALPGGTYNGIDEDIPTYITETMLTVRADLDEEYVYNLTKIFWENLAFFEEQVPDRAKEFSLDTVLNGIDPDTLHPGAKRYYEEVGALN